jgi:hypothetical protein
MQFDQMAPELLATVDSLLADSARLQAEIRQALYDATPPWRAWRQGPVEEDSKVAEHIRRWGGPEGEHTPSDARGREN